MKGMINMNKDYIFELAKKWQETHDDKIFNEIINEITPVMKSVISGMAINENGYTSVDKEDLLQECRITVFLVLKKIKLEDGKNIISYLCTAMRTALIEYIKREQNIIYLPRSVGRSNKKTMEAIESGDCEKINKKKIDLYNNTAQINKMANIDDFADKIETSGSLEDYIENKYLVETVMEEIKKLPEIDREIVTLKLIDGFSFDEIGKVLGMLRATACHKYKCSMIKIREAVKAKWDT